MSHYLIDAHLDLAYNALLLGRDLRQPVETIRAAELPAHPLGSNAGTCMASFPTLRGRITIAGSSLFILPEGEWSKSLPIYRTAEEAHRQAVAQLDYYRRLADDDPTLRILSTPGDLETVLRDWPQQPAASLGLFITMEGADPIREPGELDWWVERGVRAIAPAWGSGSRYAGGNNRPGRFTAEGRKLLQRMADSNLLLDLSHLWEEAAWEALDIYPGPLGATHANPRTFVDSPRQLSDALIRRIAERDGVIGLVPYNRMLKAGWRLGDPRLPLQRFVEAIDYVCQRIGDAAHAGIGSDFDGGFGLEAVPEGLESVADLPRLAETLEQWGYAADDIAAVLGGNWLRLIHSVLKAF